MSTLRHHLRRLSWIAFLAIFGLALAPTLSHALAAAKDHTAWAEICTPQGTRLVALDEEGAATAAPASILSATLGSGTTPSPDASSLDIPSAGLDHATHFDHCPLCGLAGTALALPPAPVAVLPPAGLSEAMPRLFLQSRRPLFAWHAAQPRGPPAAA